MMTTTLSITAFLMVYFQILHHPLFPVTVMPLTALDRMVDFQPAMLPLYLSLWVYVSLGPALLKSRSELASYGLATFAMSVIGLTIFVIWPTTVPKLLIDWTQYPSVSFLKDIDLSANACPSMHVAFAVFTAIWLERLLRETGAGRLVRMLNWLWCLGIAYSTVATRQHVMLDVLAGALLGSVVALLHLRTFKQADLNQAVILSAARTQSGIL
jgi:membrane-associated phospholipid phosphatase